MGAVCRRAAINNELVDVAQCIRSLSLPMYLIRPLPKPPKSLAVLRSVVTQRFFIFFGQNPPSLPAPRPLWGSGNKRLSPPLSRRYRVCGVCGLRSPERWFVDGYGMAGASKSFGLQDLATMRIVGAEVKILRKWQGLGRG